MALTMCAPSTAQMLRQQLSKGNNGLTKTKFLTYGIEGDSMAQVKPRLDHIQNDLMNNFKGWAFWQSCWTARNVCI